MIVSIFGIGGLLLCWGLGIKALSLNIKDYYVRGRGTPGGWFLIAVMFLCGAMQIPFIIKGVVEAYK